MRHVNLLCLTGDFDSDITTRVAETNYYYSLAHEFLHTKQDNEFRTS